MRVLHRAEELARAAEEWRDLCDRGGAASPFQRPEWILPWMRLAAPERLCAVTVSDAHGLVGLVPLHIADDAGTRTVALLGAGPAPYLDAVARPGRQRDLVEATWAELRARRSTWDLCRLDDLPPRSALRRLPAPLGWRDDEAPQAACPVLRLSPGPGAGRVTPFPPAQAHRLRRLEGRARRAGRLELQRVDVHGWEAPFDALLRLHRARWQARGETGLAATPALVEFHREVARGFAAQGRLALYSLEFDRQLVAALCGLVHADTLYLYLAGFDPALASFSPGTLLLGLAIEDATRRGLRAFDFLRGREPYKYRFGARDVVTFWRRLRPR